ncbi:hypothetical protein EMMF5_004474 [Cystobasidiomycetes sp. EMM_F5]
MSAIINSRSTAAIAITASLLVSSALALPTSGEIVGRATSGTPLAGVVAAGSSATCTAHPYETSYSGSEACGFAPGSLTNYLHIAAIDGSLDKGRCNSCLEVIGPTNTPVYVLIVDKKGGATVGNTGLDLSATAYNELTGAHVPSSGDGGAGVQMSWTQVGLEKCAVKWSGQNCPAEFKGNFCN